jgi:uncharacterized OsmC-like protein
MSELALRDLYERKARTLARRPDLGVTTVRCNARLREELACEVRHGTRTIVTDLDTTQGGGDAAPTPGDLMRAALGSCLAMGYRIWAAQLGVELETIELDVTCEFDMRGRLGIAHDVSAGWQRLSLEVHVVSDAPRADVERVIAQADRLNPMLANLSPAIARVHTLTVHSKTNPPSHRQD